jgi:hypothetical protein
MRHHHALPLYLFLLLRLFPAAPHPDSPVAPSAARASTVVVIMR